MSYKTRYFDDTTVYISMIKHDEEELRAIATETAMKRIANVASRKRRIEILSTHSLVSEIFGENANIRHDHLGAPFIEGHHEKISISHCADKVVIAVNPSRVIGIDAELWRPQLLSVKDKYLSTLEQIDYISQEDLLKAWTIKEAVYKAALMPGLSLVDDIKLPRHGSRYATAIIGGIERLFKIDYIEMTPESVITLVS